MDADKNREVIYDFYHRKNRPDFRNINLLPIKIELDDES